MTNDNMTTFHLYKSVARTLQNGISFKDDLKIFEKITILGWAGQNDTSLLISAESRKTLTNLKCIKRVSHFFLKIVFKSEFSKI